MPIKEKIRCECISSNLIYTETWKTCVISFEIGYRIFNQNKKVMLVFNRSQSNQSNAYNKYNQRDTKK